MITCTYSIAEQDFQTTKSIGIFNVAMGLLDSLARHPGIATTVLANRSAAPCLADIPCIEVRWHDAPRTSRLARIVWEQWGVYQAARKAGTDWLLLTKGFASFMQSCPVKLAVLVYDAMSDHYDRHHPGALSAAERMYFRMSFAAAIRHAQVIFTISDFTASEIRRMAAALHIASPPIITAGIGFSSMISTTPREDRVLLLVSPFPHKRTVLAIEYLERWRERSGFQGTFDCVGLLPRNSTLPAGRQWHSHGRLSHEDYQNLRQRAHTLVFFSEYEGFGMPPVEAALSGACPVYSDIPATREVMAGVGYPFANDDFDSFAVSMDRAQATTPDQVATWGRQLLARHNWPAVGSRVVSGLYEYGKTGTVSAPQATIAT